MLPVDFPHLITTWFIGSSTFCLWKTILIVSWEINVFFVQVWY